MSKNDNAIHCRDHNEFNTFTTVYTVYTTFFKIKMSHCGSYNVTQTGYKFLQTMSAIISRLNYTKAQR